MTVPHAFDCTTPPKTIGNGAERSESHTYIPPCQNASNSHPLATDEVLHALHCGLCRPGGDVDGSTCCRCSPYLLPRAGRLARAVGHFWLKLRKPRGNRLRLGHVVRGPGHLRLYRRAPLHSRRVASAEGWVSRASELRPVQSVVRRRMRPSFSFRLPRQ